MVAMDTNDGSECGCDAKEPPSEDARLRVLLIDDDEDDRLLTAERLAEIPGNPYQLDWISRYEEGLEAICQGTHDVYLLDFRLGARTGIELLREAHGHGCSGPIILLTGQGQSRTDVEALDAGADDYLEKDRLTSALLDRSIRYALFRHRVERQLEQKVRERTEELAKANAALREASQRKDEFLATLAHELRNPLAPIRNALEIVRLAGDGGESVGRQRERIERQVAQLQRLVDDLLDVSRITVGKFRLNLEMLTIQEVVEAALDGARPLFDRAKLTLTVKQPEEPIRLSGDRVRLTQALTNLLHNAAKFTEAGGRVWLTVVPAPGSVSIVVRDTGVGIPANLLPAIFNLFTQVDQSLNRSQGGLGIGLGLVRKLMEMHGGTVRAESEGHGLGSMFTLNLPT